MRRMRSPCCARAASGKAAAPPSSVMNARRFIRSNCIRSPPARAGLHDIELARISQVITERFYNLLAVGERAFGESGPSKLRQRPPASPGNPQAGDFDPAPAGDHALDARRREPGVDQLDQELDLEPVGQHDRLGAAVDGCLKQFEGSTALLLSGRHLSLGDVGSAYEIAT